MILDIFQREVHFLCEMLIDICFFHHLNLLLLENILKIQ